MAKERQRIFKPNYHTPKTRGEIGKSIPTRHLRLNMSLGLTANNQTNEKNQDLTKH